MMFKYLLISVTLFLLAAPLGAQEPTNCEYNISLLTTAHQDAEEGDLIIAISRLGDGETKQELHYRRLHNIRAFLAEYQKARAPETIILAEGERAKGFGRVELYVKGDLHSVMVLRRNADLPVGVCVYESQAEAARGTEREQVLYPWRVEKERKRRSR
jgi:hypothetical protein